jgi:hypothetical protein
MKKNFFLVILVFSVSALYCIHSFNDITKKNLYFSVDSFFGVDYFPARSSLNFIYSERNLLKTGSEIEMAGNLKLWLEIGHQYEILSKKLLLNKAGISHKVNSTEIYFKIDEIGYGKESTIFNLSIDDIFYNSRILGEYHFTGFGAESKLGDFILQAELGGNIYNTLILTSSIGYELAKNKLVLFYLFTGSDSNINNHMHSIGTEVFLNYKFINFYQTGNYQIYPTESIYSGRRRYTELSEVNMIFNDLFRIGTNYYINDSNWISGEELLWNKNMIKQSQSYFQYDSNHSRNTIMFRYYDSKQYSNKEFQWLFNYKISNHFLLGSSISYNIPSFGERYYQFGAQTKINYEIH